MKPNLPFLLIVLLLLVGIPLGVQAQDCADETPAFQVDLSGDPNANWQSDGFFSPLGNCCDFVSGTNCFTFTVYLHQDANAILVNLTQQGAPGGLLSYSVNCVQYGHVDASMAVPLCLDGPGPHQITFCRQGTATYAASISSHYFEQDVFMDPIDAVCADNGFFYLSELNGYPAGGNYFVNGYQEIIFDPKTRGPGTYEITYVYSHPDMECVGAASQTLTVHPVPAMVFPPLEYCQGESQVVLEGASPSGGYYSGNFVVNGMFNAGLSGAGDFKVNYNHTTAEGCYQQIESTITILDLPPAGAGPDEIIVQGNSLYLTALNADPAKYSYQWTPADRVVNPGMPVTETVILYQSQVFTLTVTDLNNGCTHTVDKTVFVAGPPLSVQITAQPDIICGGESTQLFVLPSGGSGKYTYDWTSNPALINPILPGTRNPIVYPAANTRFTVRVTDTETGNRISAFVDVQVKDTPKPTLALSPASVCGNETEYVLTGGFPQGGYYSIPSLNLHGITQIDPSLIVSGTYPVTYTYIVDGMECPGIATDYLTIHPRVKASFYPQQDFCKTYEVNFLNLSQNATQYQWQIGTQETFQTQSKDPFIRTFDYPLHHQVLDVTLIASNDGCSHSVTRELTITAPTIASFDILEQPAGCSPHAVTFDNTTSGPVAFFLWEFGDGSFSIEENPVHTFENFTSENITYQVILTAVAENFMCITRHTMAITVSPNVTAGFGFDAPTSCHPYDVEIFNSATGTGTILWDMGDGTAPFFSSEPFLYHTFNNLSDSPRTFTLRQTITNIQGCSEVMEQDLVVYPFQQSGFSADILEGCAPLTVTFSDLSQGAVSSWYYDFGDNGTSPLPAPVHTFENKTTAGITYTVMQITDNGFFCPDTSFVDILVQPELQAAFDFNPATICSPMEVIFTNTSKGATTWRWDMDDGTFYDTEHGVTHFFENHGTTPLTHNITLTVENEQGCIRSVSHELVVYPQVQALFEPLSLEACQPLEVAFNNLSANAHTFLWEFGDGGSSNAINPTHTYQNLNYETSETFTVSLFALSQYLCWDYFETEITILPALKADFTVEAVEGCSPFEITIDQASLGASRLLWSFGDNSPQQSGEIETYIYYNTTGVVQVYTLSLLVNNDEGCTQVLEREITVHPEITAAFDFTAEGCHPLEVNFENLSGSAATIFSWQFGQAGSSTESSPEHTFTNFSHTESVTYPVSLTAMSEFGCMDTVQSLIRVRPKPDASFSVANSPGCSPHEMSFTNASSGATQYLWDFGNDTQSDESGEVVTTIYDLAQGSQASVFVVLLQVTNDFGCTDTLSHEVIIYPPVQAAFSASTLEGCHPLTVDFTNLSTGATAYQAWQWDHGDGTSNSEPAAVHSHVFNNNSHTGIATFTVHLIAYNENECSDTTQVEIRVLPAPLADFTITNPTGCGPHEAFLVNNSLGENSFTWDFDDGSPPYNSNELQISRIFSQAPGDVAGQFHITLTATNDFGCSRPYRQLLTVFPEVVAAFESETSGCHPLTVQFENTSEGGTSSLWSFGEGNHSQLLNPEHIYFNHSYTQTLDFKISLTSTNNFGCEDTISQIITVFPVPQPTFDLAARSGCAFFETQLYNFTPGENQYTWEFGNGTSEEESAVFTHSWDNTSEEPVFYTVWLTAENSYGCVDHSLQIINVFPRVAAQFTTSDGIFEGCNPFTVQFENQSLRSQYNHWDFGDGTSTTGGSPLHVFTNEGMTNAIFPVLLTTTSVYSCTHAIVREITVFPSPSANFMPTPAFQTYPATTVDLENRSSPGTWNFEWDMGDGTQYNTTEFDTFSHTYVWDGVDMTTRTYNINLKMDNFHCNSSIMRQVTITSPRPQAQFIPDAQGCSPLHVQFTNLSQNSHSYRWSFGDGTVALEENPSHIFFDPGDYEVMLVAYGDGGADSTYHYVTVFDTPQARFYIVNPLIHIPYESLNVINQSQLAAHYKWDFGDGNGSQEFQPQHLYQQAGTYTVTLIASSATTPQCSDTLSLVNSVLVQDACRVVFPNAFKPDPGSASGGYYIPGDPANTVFYPLYEGLSEYVLEIYSRWGELLFRSTDPAIGWDGYYRGQLSKMDVYVWRFSGRCQNGKKMNMAGDVTLYR